MAPIQGITDHVFRTVFTEHFGGFDRAVAPFITSKQDRKIQKRYFTDLLPENNLRLPVVPQILSNHAGDFVHLAHCLCDLGYDTVNWNLGCPFPMVARKKRGAGLLPYTDRIADFLDAAVPRLQCRLSVKTRLGWHGADELMELLPVMDRYPLAELTVHPRTGRQRYEGSVDLAAFAQVLAATRHSVVYNGDIRTVEDFTYLAARFPSVDRWMIGRGCVINPFLPAAIRSGTDDGNNRMERLGRFHDDLFERYSALLSGPGHLLDRMKGFWRYLALLFDDSDKTLKTIFKAKSMAAYREQTARIFGGEVRIAKRRSTF
ncbi:MAG: tRNA dihydrouridine synthase [Thermodesulfobacteriota bacterium]